MTVIDRDGLSNTDTVMVTVRNLHISPTADAGGSQTVNEGATVTLDGSGSSDPDGDTFTYRWEPPQGSGIALSKCGGGDADVVHSTICDDRH